MREKIYDTFGDYLKNCGDVEFDLFCNDVYCDCTIVWNSLNNKLTEKGNSRWKQLLSSKYEISYTDDNYHIRQVNIPNETLQKSCFDFAYSATGYISASEHDELFIDENRLCMGECYVNYYVSTVLPTGEEQLNYKNLDLPGALAIFKATAYNNPIKCVTVLGTDAVTANGICAKVPIVNCAKGTFKYYDDWKNTIIGNDELFKFMADRMKNAAKDFNKDELLEDEQEA